MKDSFTTSPSVKTKKDYANIPDILWATVTKTTGHVALSRSPPDMATKQHTEHNTARSPARRRQHGASRSRSALVGAWRNVWICKKARQKMFHAPELRTPRCLLTFPTTYIQEVQPNAKHDLSWWHDNYTQTAVRSDCRASRYAEASYQDQNENTHITTCRLIIIISNKSTISDNYHSNHTYLAVSRRLESVWLKALYVTFHTLINTKTHVLCEYILEK